MTEELKRWSPGGWLFRWTIIQTILDILFTENEMLLNEVVIYKQQ